MERNWYEWLKEQIKSRNFHIISNSATECAFVHGQVQMAYLSELITEEQFNELNDIIPEY